MLIDADKNNWELKPILSYESEGNHLIFFIIIYEKAALRLHHRLALSYSCMN